MSVGWAMLVRPVSLRLLGVRILKLIIIIIIAAVTARATAILTPRAMVSLLIWIWNETGWRRGRCWGRWGSTTFMIIVTRVYPRWGWRYRSSCRKTLTWYTSGSLWFPCKRRWLVATCEIEKIYKFMTTRTRFRLRGRGFSSRPCEPPRKNLAWCR